MQSETTFMTFWSAINAELAKRGVPQITFGPARRLWTEVADRAARESLSIAMKGAA